MADCLLWVYFVIVPVVLGFLTKWPRWPAALVAAIGYMALAYGMAWLGLRQLEGPIIVPCLTLAVAFWPFVALGRWLAQRRAR